MLAIERDKMIGRGRPTTRAVDVYDCNAVRSPDLLSRRLAPHRPDRLSCRSNAFLCIYLYYSPRCSAKLIILLSTRFSTLNENIVT